MPLPTEYLISEARKDLSGLVRRVEEGEDAVITIAGRRVVRLVPVATERRNVPGGLGNGTWTLISINVHRDNLPTAYPQLDSKLLRTWLPSHSECGIAWGHLSDPVAIYAIPTEWGGPQGGSFSYYRVANVGGATTTPLDSWTATLSLAPEDYCWEDAVPGSFARTQALAIDIGNRALGITG